MSVSPRDANRDVLFCGALFLVVFVSRLANIHFNQAEYTDGILAVFGSPGAQSFWPPFYKWLSAVVGLGTATETSARLVSVLSGSLLVIPVYWMAASLFPPQAKAQRQWAAVTACLWLAVSPMALRWSVRMMTDALYALLFFGAVGSAIQAWRQRRSGGYEADGWVAAATALTVAAILTRYPGIVLIPVVGAAFIAVWLAWRRRGKGPMVLSCYSQVLWLVLLGWLWVGRDQLGAHGGQVAARMDAAWWQTLYTYGIVFWHFVIRMPYFFTVPVFILAVWGLVRSRDRLFLLHVLYLFLAVLVMQSVFKSFQSRYLLPLLPFALVLAGVGCAQFAAWKGPRRWAALTLILVGFFYSLWFSLQSFVLQRGVFGDIKEAAVYVREQTSEGATVYSNEAYGPQAVPIKMRHWSGRPVEFSFFMGPEFEQSRFKPGSIVCLHNLYGDRAFREAFQSLSRKYRLRELMASHIYEVTPLLPDVMARPGTQQHPVWWQYRHEVQKFYTLVYEVIAVR